MTSIRLVVGRTASEMGHTHIIGLVVPLAEDKVPFEGPLTYLGVRFVPRGVGVRAPTPEGHEPPWAAMRLVGDSGRIGGYGRLFEQAREPVH